MRRSLASAALVLLCACPGNDSPPGPPPPKAVGEACSARGECQSGLCFAGACAATLPAAASCPTVPGTAHVLADPNVVNAIDPGPGFCVSTVRSPFPALPVEMVQDLGTLQVGTDATFAATSGTSSFVLVSQEADGSAPDTFFLGPEAGFSTTIEIPNVVVPTNVVAPGGTLYYDDLAGWPTITIGDHAYYDFTGRLAHDLGIQSSSGAFPVPNTSAAIDRVLSNGGVTPGSWSFRVNDWAAECLSFRGCSGGSGSSTYRLHAVTRSGPIASTGAVDVEVYLATDPTSVLSTAAGAAAHPQVARWVGSVGSFLGNAGLCIGDVTFHDLPQWAKDRYAPGGDVDLNDFGICGDLDQLFTTAIVPRRAVHLFLSDGFIAPSRGVGRIAGIDGTIPGPTGFPGTISGGAAVALNDELGHETVSGACDGSGPPDLLRCGTDRLAYIAAHEIGHWLGLYHTTESDGTLFDPVSDTGMCPCSACAAAAQRNGCAEVSSNPTTEITNDRCVLSSTCGGGRNLMFWLLHPVYSTGELSPDQGRIVLLNPAVR